MPPNATLEQMVPYTEAINTNFMSTPEFDHSFQITLPTFGFGGMLVKPWEERKRSIFPIQEEMVGEAVHHLGRARAGVFASGAAERGHFAGRVRHRVDRRATRSCSGSRSRSSLEAIKSDQFAFPPIIDVKIDQAKSEIVIDRDKVASMGLNLQQVGADLSSMLGGNFVNRFNIDGRSYKVIPQIERWGGSPSIS